MAFTDLHEIGEMFAAFSTRGDEWLEALETHVATKRAYFREKQAQWRALNPLRVAAQNAKRAADPVRREKNKLAMRARRALEKAIRAARPGLVLAA